MPSPGKRTPAVPGAASPMVPPPPPIAPQPAPAQTPAPPQQQAAPPATVPVQQYPGTVAHQAPSVSANMFANTDPGPTAATGQGGGGLSIALDDLMGGAVDPEDDRKPEAYRIPRYVIEAVSAAHRLQVFKDAKGKPLAKQDIATHALRQMMPPELLDSAYRKLYGRERPTD